MKNTFVIILLFFTTLFSQENEIVADSFEGVDIYQNVYYTLNGIFYKQNKNQTWEYQNLQYGTPTDIDTNNPLEIMVYYQDLQQLVVLDNRLNFINSYTIPFGISHIANAGNNTLWIYNTLNSRIQRYNLNNQTIELSSLPLKNEIIDLKGNLNHVFAYNSNKELIHFNQLSRETKREKTAEIKHTVSLRSNHIIKKNTLYLNNKTVLQELKELTSFEITNNVFYCFNGTKINWLDLNQN
ncbi:hypothetical protein N9901_00720 [Flavobacteriaceae bacterium]|nr:hypothetical protein [Flavobacteriaceae bacterium]